MSSARPTVKAILFGATGMVGEGVLHEALQDDRVASVLVIGRRPCGVAHPNLSELLHDDFFDYSAIAPRLVGFNACLFCLGVSSIGLNERDYTRVTHDLTLRAAETLSRLNPEMTFCYVSGAGTGGRSMWARVKRRTEEDLANLPFRGVYAFRPGFLRPTKGLRNAYRIATLAGVAYPLLRRMLPKYVTTLEELGRAMVEAAASGWERKTLECRDIVRAAESRR